MTIEPQEKIATGRDAELPVILQVEKTVVWENSRLNHDNEALEGGKSLFRLVIEGAADIAIYVLDPQGRVATWNAGAERIKGYQPKEIVGRHFSVFYAEEAVDSGRPMHHLEIARKDGRVEDEGWRIRKDGSRFWANVVITALRDSTGKLLGFSKITRDLTERKRAEFANRAAKAELEDQVRKRTLELQQTVEDLSRSNLELQQFAYVASHDLQEPLRMVVSYTELLAQRYKGNLDEKADKFIRYIVEGGKRMQQLIADLLTYSRVGSKERAFTSVDTAAVVEKTLRSLSKAVEESGAEVLFGELPVVMADELQLGQVFQNLVGNAIKFRTDRTPRVAIRAKISGNEWVFCVEDNGIGIDMEYASRLFQMFHRLHDRGKYEGNGIGLAVSKKIVERHGGRIWFESELGKGAKFFFTLPVAQVGAS